MEKKTIKVGGQVVEEVQKPVMLGEWNGKHARKLGGKVFVNMLAVTFIYLLLGVMLGINNLLLQSLFSLAVVLFAFGYMRTNGLSQGEGDAAYGEIMYTRQKEGKEVSPDDRARCFHPLKGYFAAALGALPFVLITLVYAILAKPVDFGLTALPSWLSPYLQQSELGDALSYYTAATSNAMGIYRIIVRSMTMPFMTIAAKMSYSVQTWAERLSPLMVLIAPLGYAIGYHQGLRIRTRINTGIVIGVKKKRKKQRREQRRREARRPEQLV